MSDARPTAAPAVPLEYRDVTDDRREKQLWWRTTGFFILRRIIFAIGLGLLATGIGCGWFGVSQGDAPYLMGWGTGLATLAFPVWRKR